MRRAQRAIHVRLQHTRPAALWRRGLSSGRVSEEWHLCERCSPPQYPLACSANAPVCPAHCSQRRPGRRACLWAQPQPVQHAALLSSCWVGRPRKAAANVAAHLMVMQCLHSGSDAVAIINGCGPHLASTPRTGPHWAHTPRNVATDEVHVLRASSSDGCLISYGTQSSS